MKDLSKPGEIVDITEVGCIGKKIKCACICNCMLRRFRTILGRG